MSPNSGSPHSHFSDITRIAKQYQKDIERVVKIKEVQNCQLVKGQMIATRDLNPGEVILIEKPLVCGPGRQGYPVCLACYNMVDGSYFCNTCGWQLCHEGCEASPGHHRLDCQTLADNGIACEIYDFDDKTLSMDFMGPLRLALALKQCEDQSVVKSLLNINTYNEKRKGKYCHRYFIGCEDIIMKSLRDSCKVEGYSDEELLTIMGLFDMYGYPIGPTGAKAFHLSPCFMKSSCKPNTYSMILSDYSIMYKASVKIKKGESITRCYGDVTKCTYFRRREIEDQFMFLCECDRCKDATEMGTKLGGLHCPTCTKGIIVPTKPLDQESSPWKCDQCSSDQSGIDSVNKIKFINNHIDSAIVDSRGSIQVFEFILNNKGDWSEAPMSGQFMLEIKKQYLSNLGNTQGSSHEYLDTEKLETKLQICREYLKMLNAVHPGFNYQKIAIIYEMLEAGKALIGKIGGDSLKNELTKLCNEADKILKVEEEGSMYNQLNLYLAESVKSL